MLPFMHYYKRIKKRQIRRLKNAVLDQINVKQIAALASEHIFRCISYPRPFLT